MFKLFREGHRLGKVANEICRYYGLPLAQANALAREHEDKILPSDFTHHEAAAVCMMWKLSENLPSPDQGYDRVVDAQERLVSFAEIVLDQMRHGLIREGQGRSLTQYAFKWIEHLKPLTTFAEDLTNETFPKEQEDIGSEPLHEFADEIELLEEIDACNEAWDAAKNIQDVNVANFETEPHSQPLKKSTKTRPREGHQESGTVVNAAFARQCEMMGISPEEWIEQERLAETRRAREGKHN